MASLACWLCNDMTCALKKGLFDVKNKGSRKTHFGNIAVIKGVLDHQPLQHLDGDLTDLSGLLKSPAHFPQQQSHQEVVPAKVVGERVIQLQVCRCSSRSSRRNQSAQTTNSKRR